MTNKPMLSVDRELLSTALKADASIGATATELVKGWVAMVELRSLLDKPVVESEFEPDAVCTESDGCPTEGAVLKRFWRENQPDPVLCEFYEAEDFPSLVRELVGHVAQLQEAAKRNVKPWEDTFPPTLLPAYIARINAEQPAPVADQAQCEECKGWGYHENHHEGGGTECGECGGSGNATVAVAVVMPDRMKAEPFTTIDRGSKNYKAGYNAALAEVARLNGVKP